MFVCGGEPLSVSAGLISTLPVPESFKPDYIESTPTGALIASSKRSASLIAIDTRTGEHEHIAGALPNTTATDGPATHVTLAEPGALAVSERDECVFVVDRERAIRCISLPSHLFDSVSVLRSNAPRTYAAVTTAPPPPPRVETSGSTAFKGVKTIFK